MKRILLMRHAESSQAGPGSADFDRPLESSGREAAAGIGELLRQAGLTPDHILCSPARRTRETLEEMRAGWELRPPVAFEDGLYEATSASLLDHLRSLSADRDTVLVVGHNPAVQEAARDLAGTGEPEEYARMKTGFPTGAVAILALEGESWIEAAPGRAILERFLTPTDLGR